MKCGTANPFNLSLNLVSRSRVLDSSEKTNTDAAAALRSGVLLANDKHSAVLELLIMMNALSLHLTSNSSRWLRGAIRTFASVGDKLPSVDLHLGFPPKKYNLAEYAAGKKIVLVGLPGAL